MNKIIKALLAGLLPVAAMAEEPIITIHSSAYADIGESNQFSFLIGTTEPTYLDIDMGAGLNEVEVGVANINVETGEWEGTWVPMRATAEGVIKIYGDASKIDVLVMDGAYITDIDMAQCTNLEILSMEHNVLQSLDLTPFSKLMAIYMTDNPFTAQTPLIIGGPKPSLQILEVDIVDHLDPNLNISLYPNLVVFDAYHTLGLRTIDPTGCLKLQSLSVEMTAVETIDVSKNPQLMSLNVSESRIRNLDLSNNKYLTYLMAGHASGSINTDVKMDQIDLTHNPELFYLSLTGNNLTSIDLSKNTKIQNLVLNHNQLTDLDLSANVNLYSVNVANNNMTIATLPLPESTWGEYFYSQRPMPVSRVLGVGEVLDLSSKVLREGTTTTALVMRKPFTGQAEELDASLYSYQDGKITFQQAVADSVYVEYYNDVLNEYRQRTTMFKVKEPSEVGKPSKCVDLNIDPSRQTFNINIGIAGATSEIPKTFIVDFGEGTQQEYTTTTAGLDETITIVTPPDYRGRPTIYMPEGNDITALGLNGITIYDVGLKAATTLQQLSLTNGEMYEIDLRYNRCLEYLDLSGNNLLELSLYGIYGDYEKTVLSTLKAANNRLETLKFSTGGPIRTLDLSGNRFTELPMEEFNNVEDINISNNMLSGLLSLAYQLNSKRIDISGNPITSLRVDKFSNLQYFNVSNTGLNFATLPLPSTISGEYVYAPLNDLQIQEKAPAVNLTSQNLVIDGVGTDYVWKKADGTVLTQGVDIDCVNGGTRFLKEDLGSIYCEMTNPAFPGLTLKTTEVTVVGPPTNMIASFTSTEAVTGEMILRGYKNSALYIDWRGDGTEFMEYPFNTADISIYDFPAYKNATAKIYTYGDATDLKVFSLYRTPMSSVDVSKLTSLISLSIGGAGMTPQQMKLPDGNNLIELKLDGNKLTDFPFAQQYTKLQVLSLSNNAFTEFDASTLPYLTGLYMMSNKLKDIKFNNPYIWDLQLSGNRFEKIDLTGLKSIEQISLMDNLLTDIDLKPVSKTLQEINIVGNRFTYQTLPNPSECPSLTIMRYGLQAPLEVECVDGKVDLSSQAEVRGVGTTYTWYLGEATLDSNDGVYVGEELIEDEEYTVENGVTTFLYTFNEKVMCVMSNPLYPNLLLPTERVAVDKASIDEVENPEMKKNGGIYDLQGRRVTKPGKGIYIVNGKTVLL